MYANGRGYICIGPVIIKELLSLEHWTHFRMQNFYNPFSLVGFLWFLQIIFNLISLFNGFLPFYHEVKLLAKLKISYQFFREPDQSILFIVPRWRWIVEYNTLPFLHLQAVCIYKESQPCTPRRIKPHSILCTPYNKLFSSERSALLKCCHAQCPCLIEGFW